MRIPRTLAVWIGELARRAGCSPKTIRYYEKFGLLNPPARTAGGFRDYGEEVVEQLRFIRAAQGAGMHLGEIRAVVAFRDRGTPPCRHVMERIVQLNESLPALIDTLGDFRDELRRLGPPASGPTRDAEMAMRRRVPTDPDRTQLGRAETSR